MYKILGILGVLALSAARPASAQVNHVPDEKLLKGAWECVIQPGCKLSSYQTIGIKGVIQHVEKAMTDVLTKKIKKKNRKKTFAELRGEDFWKVPSHLWNHKYYQRFACLYVYLMRDDEDWMKSVAPARFFEIKVENPEELFDKTADELFEFLDCCTCIAQIATEDLIKDLLKDIREDQSPHGVPLPDTRQRDTLPDQPNG